MGLRVWGEGPCLLFFSFTLCPPGPFKPRGMIHAHLSLGLPPLPITYLFDPSFQTSPSPLPSGPSVPLRVSKHVGSAPMIIVLSLP